MPRGFVVLGEIGRPHGVRGLLRVRSFTAAPSSLTAYGPLTDESGARVFALTLLAPDLARIEGVADREAAQRLTGTKLCVARDRLPPPEDPEEFYLSDLEGLLAVDAAGAELGRVQAVEDHGAGTFLVVGPHLVPFTKACVPVVDVEGGRVVVELPAVTEARGEGEAA
jgi:16S rRNA processing protein RimM